MVNESETLYDQHYDEDNFYNKKGYNYIDRNDEVVEYAMSRTMSPLLVSQYQLQLPDKAVLEKKLQQLVNIPQIED